MDHTLLIEERSGDKQGHRVLCCCDSRKATIIFALVALASATAALAAIAQGSLSFEGVPKEWSITVYAVSILFYVLVIWGAIRFHRCAVMCSVTWEILAVVALCIAAAEYDWGAGTAEDNQILAVAVALPMVWRLLVIYAEGTFVHEVRKGIMSERTHGREKYSCCCNV